MKHSSIHRNNQVQIFNHRCGVCEILELGCEVGYWRCLCFMAKFSTEVFEYSLSGYIIGKMVVWGQILRDDFGFKTRTEYYRLVIDG